MIFHEKYTNFSTGYPRVNVSDRCGKSSITVDKKILVFPMDFPHGFSFTLGYSSFFPLHKIYTYIYHHIPILSISGKNQSIPISGWLKQPKLPFFVEADETPDANADGDPDAQRRRGWRIGHRHGSYHG
jgi:hypothetical protein